MSKTTNKTTISLEEFSETYNNFDELFGSGFSEAEKRKELAKAYKVHGNTITNLIKRAKDVGFVDSTNSLWVNDDSVTETENVDEFFTHAKSTL